jgi:hypothetical protein
MGFFYQPHFRCELFKIIGEQAVFDIIGFDLKHLAEGGVKALIEVQKGGKPSILPARQKRFLDCFDDKSVIAETERRFLEIFEILRRFYEIVAEKTVELQEDKIAIFCSVTDLFLRKHEIPWRNS